MCIHTHTSTHTNISDRVFKTSYSKSFIALLKRSRHKLTLIYVYLRLHIFVCIYIYVCKYMCIYMYTHTHAQIYLTGH